MAGKVECACGKQYTWKPELAGKRARCKACQGVVSFPAEDPAVAELAGDDPFAVDDAPPPPPPPVRAAPARRSAAAAPPPPPPPAGFEDTYDEAAPPPPPPPPPGGGPVSHAPPVPISGAKSVGESGGGGGFSWGVLVNLLIGVGLIGFAVWQFNMISSAEAIGKDPSFGRKGGILRLIYNFAGKWGVVGLFAGIGVMMLLGGLAVIMGKRKAPAAEDE